MAKKYSKDETKKALSLKEQSPAQVAMGEVRYATPEMMEKAVTEVMKIHGSALRKLAQ